MDKEKDSLQIWLESECKIQAWAKKQIAKKVETVKEINTLSISSIKQKLK